MRRIAEGCLMLFAVGSLVIIVPQIWSQSRGPDRESGVQRPEPRLRGGRGFTLPPPPVLTAIDADKDGEISADELTHASTALKKLDKNKDGQIADSELRPDFGGGGFPFPRGGPGGFNPFDGGGVAERVEPRDIKPEDGLAAIPDHATYHQLSYRGEEVMIDTFLADLEFVKFTLDKAATDEQRLYFINTKKHRAHMMFARVAGLPFGRGDDQMKGVLVYRPLLKSPSGKPGLYTFEFEPFDAYSHTMVKTCQDKTDSSPSSRRARGSMRKPSSALSGMQ